MLLYYFLLANKFPFAAKFVSKFSLMLLYFLPAWARKYAAFPSKSWSRSSAKPSYGRAPYAVSNRYAWKRPTPYKRPGYFGARSGPVSVVSKRWSASSSDRPKFIEEGVVRTAQGTMPSHNPWVPDKAMSYFEALQAKIFFAAAGASDSAFGISAVSVSTSNSIQAILNASSLIDPYNPEPAFFDRYEKCKIAYLRIEFRDVITSTAPSVNPIIPQDVPFFYAHVCPGWDWVVMGQPDNVTLYGNGVTWAGGKTLHQMQTLPGYRKVKIVSGSSLTMVPFYWTFNSGDELVGADNTAMTDNRSKRRSTAPVTVSEFLGTPMVSALTGAKDLKWQFPLLMFENPNNFQLYYTQTYKYALEWSAPQIPTAQPIRAPPRPVPAGLDPLEFTEAAGADGTWEMPSHDAEEMKVDDSLEQCGQYE